MKNKLSFLLLSFILLPLHAHEPATAPEVLGLSIALPSRAGLAPFLSFMEEELAPGGINTLVLRVDYNYAYQSYPALRNEGCLTAEEIGTLVKQARTLGIRLIPQINLLGHQSWHSRLEKLLEVYPEFDETPSVVLPEEYVWPNEDGLYCKSYCPLHPGVHKVVFALVDEIMEVFEAKAFHAGMDEVFYIGMDECPRCRGKDRSLLFAGEVNLVRDHLTERGWELWIWGDRLIDGSTSGLGMWEASENDTHRAIDMIAKDVVICDWHYERADPTAACFAQKGFRVLSCPWNNAQITLQQLDMMDGFMSSATETSRQRYLGFLQTVWSSAEGFMEEYSGMDPADPYHGQAGSLLRMMDYYAPKK